MINSDLIDLLRLLNENQVKYLIVGAYAVIYYAEPRYTKDLDIWVEPSKKNAQKLWKALAEFGAPLENVTIADFQNPEIVFQIGVEPNRIDILMGIEGLTFKTAWKRRLKIQFDSVKVSILSIDDLITSKKMAGRLQDKLDLKYLKKAKNRLKK
ncbi:hypothetical protein B1H10_06250 [candidate division KSB1 bacterium 4484_188]|nr:MAG: hypothetical protein B1H10_06250 [candidate division KSB1 bacterium 4484_188]